jgi:hypothetical protein
MGKPKREALPDGPLLLRQEALPSVTSMVPMRDGRGVAVSSNGDILASASSSAGACNAHALNPG